MTNYLSTQQYEQHVHPEYKIMQIILASNAIVCPEVKSKGVNYLKDQLDWGESPVIQRKFVFYSKR